MARFLSNLKKTKGELPGSMIFIGKKKMEKPVINVFKYDDDSFEESEYKSVEPVLAIKKTHKVNWINIDGLHEVDLIKKLGEKYSIHSLHLEDIVNTDQRPRFEEGDNYLYFVLKMLSYDNKQKKIFSEQISLFLGEKYLITMQEVEGDVFDPIRDRIRNNKGKIRSCGNDYLTYALLDIIVDNYIFIIETIGDHIEELESKILLSPNKSTIKEIYIHKMELNYLRKCIRPVRDSMYHLFKNETDVISESTIQFFKDLNDHIIQASEAIETYHVIVSDELSIYNANVSNRMNEIMKVLTIFAAIFIPLTFFAGIYGMNFKYFPELGYKYSYLFFWIFILTATLSMIVLFKRKKWF